MVKEAKYAVWLLLVWQLLEETGLAQSGLVLACWGHAAERNVLLSMYVGMHASLIFLFSAYIRCVFKCSRRAVNLCQGAEECGTLVLGRAPCVGRGCVQSRIPPISASLSIYSSYYCILVTVCLLQLCSQQQASIHRSHTDSWWTEINSVSFFFFFWS